MPPCLRPCLCAAALLALSACATVPESLRGDFADIDPRAAGRADVGETVRWGGKLLAIRPEQARSCYEILSLPLDRISRPIRRDPPGRRFLACGDSFIDPATLTRDRLITVTGTLTDFETRPIGDYPYEYPVLRLVRAYAWSEPMPAYTHDPWMEDPFFYPGRRFPRPWHPWSEPEDL